MASNRYIYTNHAKAKMQYYGISGSLVERTIRFPDRVELAIVDDLVAAMKQTKSKSHPEVWVMYIPIKENNQAKLKIITTWRYPGVSAERDPVPEKILSEVRGIIGF